MTNTALLKRARDLKFYGMIAHWEEMKETYWIEQLITWEEEERSRRSLERRLGSARLGRFNPLANFDWNWPKKIDRESIEELMRLEFMNESSNIILCAPMVLEKQPSLKTLRIRQLLKGTPYYLSQQDKCSMNLLLKMVIMRCTEK